MTYQVKNEKLNNWVREVADLCQPDKIHWCDGSKEEYDRLMAQMVAEGRATPLKKRSNCFLSKQGPLSLLKRRIRSGRRITGFILTSSRRP
jgi:phosphoenolpyruvate carboxykinase (GTP)